MITAAEFIHRYLDSMRDFAAAGSGASSPAPSSDTPAEHDPRDRLIRDLLPRVRLDRTLAAPIPAGEWSALVRRVEQLRD